MKYHISLSIGLIAYLIYNYTHNIQASNIIIFVVVCIISFAPKLIIMILDMLGKNNIDETTDIVSNPESTIISEDWDFATDRNKENKE